MKLRIRYFGSAGDDAGASGEIIEVPDGSGLNAVHDRLSEIHPAIGKRWSSLLVAVNQSYVSGDAAVRDGDEIAIFPAVSGG